MVWKYRDYHLPEVLYRDKLPKISNSVWWIKIVIKFLRKKKGRDGSSASLMLGDWKRFFVLSRLDNVPAEQETFSMTPSLILWDRSNLALNSYSTLLSLFYDLSLFPHVIHSHRSHCKSAAAQYCCKSLVNACVLHLSSNHSGWDCPV